MPSWVLVPCLVSLRDEFNELAPRRDKASDGSIGDPAHASSSSDHNPDETGTTTSEDADNVNEVHAIDVDKDLNESGWSMARAVQIIVTRHRNGQDDRLQNVIYNRVIYSRSWGWTGREYTGSNPHDKHAHFSSRYTTAEERDTSPWGLLEAEDDMTKDQFFDWMDEWWKSRFSPNQNPIGLPLEYLRRSVWNQVVNATTGETMYQWMSKAQASLAATQSLAQVFAAYVDAQDIEDEETAQKLEAMRVLLVEIEAELPEANDVPPGN